MVTNKKFEDPQSITNAVGDYGVMAVSIYTFANQKLAMTDDDKIF